MLARWQSPRYGLVSPEIFIPIAEEIGLIGELSERLIRQALEDAKDWDPSLTLSVNISPIQLRDPWFAQKLLQLLVESGFPPSRLEIEITESCLHENIGRGPLDRHQPEEPGHLHQSRRFRHRLFQPGTAAILADSTG